jgi:HlyD family type I secretion membrane fusion protein
VRSADQNIGYIKEQLQINDTLQRENFVARMRVLDYWRQLAQKEEDRGEYVAKIGAARQKMRDIELRIENLHDSYVREAADELKDSPRRIADLKERIRPSEDQLKRAVVVAPIAGVVVDLKVHTTGGVVAPRDPLMDIVPEQSVLIIEGKMQTTDIRHVQIGADVDLQLIAYKRRVTPRVPGTLSYVSADSLVDRTPAGDRPYYLVQIVVKKEDLKKAGELELTPGMPVEAFIRTQERTMLEYLLQPLTDSIRRAFREY